MSLELKNEQKQTLIMTPAIIQAIRVLGLSKAELDEYLDEEISTNPILEIDQEFQIEADEKEEPSDERMKRDKRSEDFDWAEYLKEREYDDVSYSYGYSGSLTGSLGENSTLDTPDKYDGTLKAYLIEQLSAINFTKTFEDVRSASVIALYVIEALDENGFLTESIEEVAISTGAGTESVTKIVKTIQAMDPPGVCARTLEECLLLQLDRIENQDEGIRNIVANHLEDVAANRIDLIAKQTGQKKKQVIKAVELIKSLEPKPGRGFADGEEVKYIIPDVIIEKENDEFVIYSNSSGSHKLMVSSYYRDVIETSKNDRDDEAYKFLTERLNSAVLLIKSLEQREQTIYNVTSEILKHQGPFFEKGQKYLKSLTLKKIAHDLGIHESTVSRAIKGKYVQTPIGVFELKYFFDSGVSDSSGEGVASSSIKRRIEEMVSKEDKKMPLSDETITKMFDKEGITISRRTIAKYRDEAGILSSSKRRDRS